MPHAKWRTSFWFSFWYAHQGDKGRLLRSDYVQEASRHPRFSVRRRRACYFEDFIFFLTVMLRKMGPSWCIIGRWGNSKIQGRRCLEWISNLREVTCQSLTVMLHFKGCIKTLPVHACWAPADRAGKIEGFSPVSIAVISPSWLCQCCGQR